MRECGTLNCAVVALFVAVLIDLSLAVHGISIRGLNEDNFPSGYCSAIFRSKYACSISFVENRFGLTSSSCFTGKDIPTSVCCKIVDKWTCSGIRNISQAPNEIDLALVEVENDFALENSMRLTVPPKPVQLVENASISVLLFEISRALVTGVSSHDVDLIPCDQDTGENKTRDIESEAYCVDFSETKKRCEALKGSPLYTKEGDNFTLIGVRSSTECISNVNTFSSPSSVIGWLNSLVPTLRTASPTSFPTVSPTRIPTSIPTGIGLGGGSSGNQSDQAPGSENRFRDEYYAIIGLGAAGVLVAGIFALRRYSQSKTTSAHVLNSDLYGEDPHIGADHGKSLRIGSVKAFSRSNSNESNRSLTIETVRSVKSLNIVDHINSLYDAEESGTDEDSEVDEEDISRIKSGAPPEADTARIPSRNLKYDQHALKRTSDSGKSAVGHKSSSSQASDLFLHDISHRV